MLQLGHNNVNFSLTMIIIPQELNELHKKSPHLHYNVGYEVAGIVIATGQDVTHISIGDRVTGSLLKIYLRLIKDK